MKTYFKIIAALALMLAFSQVNAQGYEITLKMKEFANQQVILAHYFSDRMIPDDTTRLDAQGVGVFRKNKKLQEGMYLMFLPNRRYFDFLIGENQVFRIENDTIDMIRNARFTQSADNDLLFEYQKFLGDLNDKASQVRARRERATTDAERQQADQELQQMNNEVQNKLNQMLSQHSNSFFAAFIRATQEITIPESVPDDQKFMYYVDNFFQNMPLTDMRLIRTPIYERKIKQYLELLNQLPADTIIPRIERVFNETGVNNPAKFRDHEIFRMILVMFHNHFASSQIVGHDKVMVHMAEKHYLPKAHWADAEYVSKLKDQVAKTKPNLIGNKAPNLTMQMLPADTARLSYFVRKTQQSADRGFDLMYDIVLKNTQDAELRKALTDQAAQKTNRNRTLTRNQTKENKNDNETRIQRLVYTEHVKLFEGIYNEIDNFTTGHPSVHQIKARHTIVWFWEPDCSHCKIATPILRDLYEKYNKVDMGIPGDKNLEVYAVFLPRGLDDWEKFTHSLKNWFDFVRTNKLNNWYNVWDPYGETKFRENYNVYSSPVSYVLDKDKKIVVKRLDPNIIRKVLFDSMVSNWDSFQNPRTFNDLAMRAARIFTTKEELDDLYNAVKAVDRRSQYENTLMLLADMRDKAPAEKN